MAKAKRKPESPFVGRWNLSLPGWDESYLNAEVQAYIEFAPDGSGEFQFGYVHGWMDCRLTTRDGQQAVEWTWEGNDEMDPAQGRGWGVLKGDELQGMIFFHQSDDAEFVATKTKGPQRKKRK
jgi:hypothetical protein